MAMGCRLSSPLWRPPASPGLSAGGAWAGSGDSASTRGRDGATARSVGGSFSDGVGTSLFRLAVSNDIAQTSLGAIVQQRIWRRDGWQTQANLPHLFDSCGFSGVGGHWRKPIYSLPDLSHIPPRDPGGSRPMYVPPAFREDDLAVLHALMRDSRLANLVTATGEGLVATPLPLFLVPQEGSSGTLYGHVA